MRRILGWGALRRGRRGKSLIILFKSMRLHQCALAIFRLLFSGDLWPFGFSINTTARMKEDAPFQGFMPLQRTPLRRFSAKKMNTINFEVVFILAMLCCVAAGLDCNKSVGLEHRELPDNSIRASSHSPGHQPYLGRLNNMITKINETKTVWGAWCAKDSNLNQYLQVDLEVVRNITGVATQGYDYGGKVKSYQIMYSLNGKQWFEYKKNGTRKTFKGNFDYDSIVYHDFDNRLAARFIRFNPRSWSVMICMRVDIYACELPKSKRKTTIPPTTKELPTSTTKREFVTTVNNEVRVTEDDVKIKTTKEEQATMVNIITFDNRINAGYLHLGSIPLLSLCVLLVYCKLFN